MRITRVALLLCLSLGCWAWAWRWFAHYSKVDSYQDGLVPFQAVIYDQHQNSYRNVFTATHSGKHLIVFSYAHDDKGALKQAGIVQPNASLGTGPQSPSFSWSIKSGKTVILGGEANSAPVSGTREWLLGTIDLKSGEVYTFAATLHPSFMPLLAKLPEVSIMVESKSPEFMISIYRQYGVRVSSALAVLALLASWFTAAQILKLRRQSRDSHTTN